MPTNTEEPQITVSDADVVDERDQLIEDLSQESDRQTQKIEDLTKLLDAARADSDRLREKLKSAKSAPTGDVVFLGGVSYPILSTHRADNTYAEVKRGHVSEGLTLVAIDKQH